MKVYSYITKDAVKITQFHPSMKNEKATFSVWSTDGTDNLLSFTDAIPATYEQIDDRAEREGLTAWYNGH